MRSLAGLFDLLAIVLEATIGQGLSVPTLEHDDDTRDNKTNNHGEGENVPAATREGVPLTTADVDGKGDEEVEGGSGVLEDSETKTGHEEALDERAIRSLAVLSIKSEDGQSEDDGTDGFQGKSSEGVAVGGDVEGVDDVGREFDAILVFVNDVQGGDHEESAGNLTTDTGKRVPEAGVMTVVEVGEDGINRGGEGGQGVDVVEAGESKDGTRDNARDDVSEVVSDGVSGNVDAVVKEGDIGEETVDEDGTHGDGHCLQEVHPFKRRPITL